MTSQDSDYEFIEVKVSNKIDIHLSLDDLINAVQRGGRSSWRPPNSRSTRRSLDKLNQLAQLATPAQGSAEPMDRTRQSAWTERAPTRGSLGCARSCRSC